MEQYEAYVVYCVINASQIDPANIIKDASGRACSRWNTTTFLFEVLF